MKGYAFFDVDGTLINMTSMVDFQAFASARGAFPASLNLALCRWLLKAGKQRLPRNLLNRLYYRQFAGCSRDAIEALGEQWFEQRVRHATPSCWNEQALQQLRWHQQQGHCVVLVSGSFTPLLAPLARCLGVHDILCANPQTRHGRYNGRLTPPQTIGIGKATAIALFLDQRHAGSVPAIWAYGDHSSDLPMLLKAHTPVVVAGDPALQAYARARGWTILEEPHS